MTSVRTAGSSRRSDAEFVVLKRAEALGGFEWLRARFVTRSSCPHTHSHFELGTIVTGRRLVTCRGVTQPATRGCILLFNPGEVHSGRPGDGSAVSYRSFLLPANLLQQARGCSAAVVPNVPVWFSQPVVRDGDLAHRMVEVHTALERGGSPNVERRLVEILTALLVRHGGSRPAETVERPDLVAARRVQEHLERNYASRIRLETLAAIAGLNVFHLIRAFRAATGLTPYAFLEQIRIDRAAELLRDGHAVSAVAFRTGFSDQSHLTRFFKRVVGVPPGQYQRNTYGSRVATGK